MDISSVIEFFNMFGLSKDTIAIFIALYLFYLFLDKKQFKKISITHEEIKDNVLDMHNATREIQNFLLTKGSESFYSPIHKLDQLKWGKTNSPLGLNTEGEKLLLQSGMERIVRENIETIVKMIEESKPDNRLDVQKLSFVKLGIYLNSNKELIRKIKEFVYENPKFSGKETSLDDIIFVGSLMVRDEYLKKHKNFNKK